MRIGNWFEEMRLKQDTGTRFYQNPKDRTGSLLTQSRCITHTEQTHPKDYSSNTRDTIVDPRKHSEYRGKTSTVGPRARLLEETIRREIEEESIIKKKQEFMETRRTNYSTTNKESFGINTFRPSLRENDPTLRIPTKASNYSTDAAVTYYSHAISKPELPMGFPATFVGSTNPLKICAAFSSDVVREQVAKRTETNERPRHLPTLLEFRALNELRQRLIRAAQDSVGDECNGHTDGRAVRHLLDTLWNSQTGLETVEYNALQNSLATIYSGLQVTPMERNAILCAYDARSDGNVSLPELTNLVRRTPSPRRLELVDIFYSSLDREGTGSIPSNLLRRLASANPTRSMQVFMNTVRAEEVESVGVDEFFDFYTDLSAEIADNDELFEALLVETWGSDMQ